MANTPSTPNSLVIIRGLDRGTRPAGSPSQFPGTGLADGPTQIRGFRVKAPIGRSYKQETGSASAAFTYTTGVPATGQVTFTANYPGAYGNSIQVALTNVAGGETIATTWQANSGNPVITVTVPSGVTASGVANFVNTDETASQFVTAAYQSTGGGNPGTFAATNLTGGSNGVNFDAEPSPEVEGLAGEPIWLRVTNKTALVVDTTDLVTARILKRNKWRYEVVGYPT